jgi:hypothetical protein
MHRTYLGILFVSVLVGCSGPPEFPELYLVKANVVYAGGKPLTHGYVEFESEADPQWRATAGIRPDGTVDEIFSVKSNGKQAPGLVLGSHKVCVSPDPTNTGRNGPTTPIPSKYGSFATTDLRVTVEKTGNNLTITIAAK